MKNRIVKRFTLNQPTRPISYNQTGAAEYLGISTPTLRKLLKAGEIQHNKTSDKPGAHCLISKNALDEYLLKQSDKSSKNDVTELSETFKTFSKDQIEILKLIAEIFPIFLEFLKNYSKANGAAPPLPLP